MKLIGITGGIGSGKSTVAKYIERAGYPVYYSDNRAKEIVTENAIVKQKIIELLGEESYIGEDYNRSFVARKIFENPLLLASLNGIIHPEVAKDFEVWKNGISSNIAFKETALLFENNLHKGLYKSLLVTADTEIRIARVMSRDHKTRLEVEAIIQKQMPEIEKISLADFVISNNESEEKLREKVEDFLRKILVDINSIVPV